MIRGGGNPLLEGKVEVSSNAQASQTDLIRDEVIGVTSSNNYGVVPAHTYTGTRHAVYSGAI
jgi:hypothetical protein